MKLERKRSQAVSKNQQTRTIIVRSQVTGDGAEKLKGLANSLTQLNKSTRTISSSLDNFGKGFRSLFAASLFTMAARNAIGMTDGLQQLQDRIFLLTGDMSKAEEVLGSLSVMANNTRAPISDLATNYVRLSNAVEGTGISTSTMLGVTELLQKSFLISGSSSREAAAASIQLSQGLASGALRGEEFNSVMEQNVVLGTIMAKHFDVTRGELRKMAAQGMITSKDVLSAMVNNMEDLNAKAGKLRVTIGQALTIAMNDLALSAHKVNQGLGIGSGISKGIIFLSNNSDILFAALMGLAVTAIPMLVTQVKALMAVLSVGSAFNPIIALSGTLVAMLSYIAANIELASASWLSFKSTALSVFADIVTGLGKMAEATREFFGIQKQGANDVLLSYGRELDKRAKIAKVIGDMRLADIKAQKEDTGGFNLDKARKEIESMMTKTTEKVKKAKDYLKELNSQFLKDGDVQKYMDALGSTRLDMLSADFRSGKMDLVAYTEAMNNLKKVELNKEFSQGLIDLTRYNAEMLKLSESNLDLKLKAGAISLKEFRSEMVQLNSSQITFWEQVSVGVDRYLAKTKTLSEAVASMTEMVLKGVEDQFVEFVTKGRADWKSFGNAVMEELVRITYQLLIMKPLLDSFSMAIGGGGGTTVSSTPTAPASSGTGYLGFDSTFAKGGVVTNATAFSYGSNKMGLMGEAGPEAVMPLRRGKDGSLGVQATTAPVYININNTTGADVQTSESTGANGERMIEVTIVNAVRKGMENGTFDNAMARNYNVRRQGV